MTSRQIPTITSADQLPERYPTGGGLYNPRLDWLYIQAATGPGARFAGAGVLFNAEHARQRLVRAGFIQDHTEGGTDEQDSGATQGLG